MSGKTGGVELERDQVSRYGNTGASTEVGVSIEGEGVELTYLLDFSLLGGR